MFKKGDKVEWEGRGYVVEFAFGGFEAGYYNLSHTGNGFPDVFKVPEHELSGSNWEECSSCERPSRYVDEDGECSRCRELRRRTAAALRRSARGRRWSR